VALLCKFKVDNCEVVFEHFFVYFKVFDSPEKHPRIHAKEKEYILATLGSSVMRSTDKKRNVPWKAILTSRPVWVNSIAQWGGIWGLFTILTQAPTYFSLIHGWGIEMTGVLSGLPHLLRVGFSIAFSNFGDYLLTNDKMSRNNVRRLATLFSKF
jgi:Major Facilitator Superfamily